MDMGYSNKTHSEFAEMLLQYCDQEKAPHIMLKAPHIMLKALHIMMKVQHIMLKAPSITMKVQRIMMKAEHVKNIDHIRQSWLSIFPTI